MFPARHARIPASAACLLISLALLPASAFAFTQAKPPNHGPRILTNVDEANLVTLKGNTHPAALPKFDQGAVSDSLPMQHMFLVLKRSPEQQQAFAKLLDDQQNPASPSYHKWLTAEELGKTYGPAPQDIDTVVSWLKYHGFQVNGISKSGLTVDVSGTAGQVRDAFHTAIHMYDIAGKRHIANATDPQIPAALAPVVVGFSGLHDFKPKPAMSKAKPALTFTCDSTCPGGFSGVTQYDETPEDFATIYNVTPLYVGGSAAITGKGQTIAVLEDSDAQSIDISSFRKAFGIDGFSGSYSEIHPAGTTGTPIPCTDPGKTADEYEAAPDAEWANAIAPDANVELAACASSGTTFGALVAAQNLLDSTTPPPIMSLSYVQCETSLGPSGNAFVNSLWSQAASEGVSVFVAAGDSGPAACDDPNTASFATGGIAANGFASTPFNVAVGGTDFKDTSNHNNAGFWNTTNSSTTFASAKSYIPETPWNDSCAGSVFYSFSGFASGALSCNNASNAGLLDVVAGGGAPSAIYAKPVWQVVDGNPADKKRDLPDVSLFASDGFWNHSIVFCMSDTGQDGTPCTYTVPLDVFNNSAGGTSFTAPQLASIQALINQKKGASQGNVAPRYYSLAQTEYGTTAAPNTTNLTNCKSALGKNVGTTCIFYDITTGNINVPCFGSSSCFTAPGDTYGLLSTSNIKLSVAYPQKTGWDFATGIGSVNVTNLVNNF